MVSDKDVLIQAVEGTAKGIVSQLFGVDTLATQTLITYVTRNLANKYDIYIDALTNEQGNIDIDILGNAAKSAILAKGGLKLGKIKFTESDIEQLISKFKELKSKN